MQIRITMMTNLINKQSKQTSHNLINLNFLLMQMH